jgi:hypothetical protein
MSKKNIQSLAQVPPLPQVQSLCSDTPLNILAHKPTTHSVVYIDYSFTIVTSGSWSICVANLKTHLHHIAGVIGRASLMSPSHDIGWNCLSPSLTMIPMLDRVLYNFLHDEAKFKKSIFKKLFIFFQF